MMERPNVFFPAAACPKARVDLEKHQVAVEDAGFGIAADAKKADLVVIFTCGFIDDAKKESIADILAYCALKKQGSVRAIVVVGCMPEKYGLDLAKEVPQVDAFLGNTQLHTLPAVLRRLAAKQPVEKLAKSASFEGAAGQAAQPRRAMAAAEPWTRAVLICDGCNNACTYCAIPEMRGPLRSRTIESIVEEVNLLVGQGAKEIVLAGQDTASYGRDRGKGELGDLAAAVVVARGEYAQPNPEPG
jgi:ribosomal protein S12 methylthiotransferase